jgi:hypothetical protein
MWHFLAQNYTVHGPVQARASLHLLALGPGPRGSGQASWPLAPGQGRARAGPGPPISICHGVTAINILTLPMDVDPYQ